MNWLDRLERRFPKLALEGLIRYISFLMLTVFVLDQMHLLSYETLYLNSFLIKKGQVWRLFTFLFIPASQNFLFLIFELLILVMCADGLEAEWGTFKLTVYYLFGAVATILVSFFMPLNFFDSHALYLTFFLGFATIYPDYEILLFFILPVKIKWLAMLSGGWILYTIAVSPISIKIVVLTSVANYLVFFGPDFVNRMRGNFRAHQRRREFEAQARPADGPRHVCSVCGRTEISNPELQFRYCTCPKCGENGVAFCMDHIKQHKEKKTEPHEVQTES